MSLDKRDLSRAMMRPFHFIHRVISERYLNPNSFWEKIPLFRSLGAIHEIMARVTSPKTKPSFGIESIEISDEKIKISEECLYEKPFCKIIHFKKRDWTEKQPTVLLVAPLSGHFSTLLRNTVVGLLAENDVLITDWICPSDVPLSEGVFDLDTYVDYMMEFAESLGPNLSIVAVCQPSVPVFMAVCLLAEDGKEDLISSIVLMGGPIDTRINPTKINKNAETLSLAWFKKYMCYKVPLYRSGAGRLVTPGDFILSAFIDMNLDTHAKNHFEYIRNIVEGNADKAEAHRNFYEEYLATLDMPAEYFIQTIDKVFQRHLLPKGKMNYRNRLIKPEKNKKTALLTIEGLNDDITGIGQTKAAHDLCVNLPKSKKMHFEHPKVGHYGIFSGSRWREDIAPLISCFIKKNQH